MRRSIRIAAGPQTAKHARRIADGPQAHHRFRRACQAANRRHASEAKTTRYHGASRGPTPWWWFPLCTRVAKCCRCPACTARIPSSKRAAWMQRGSRSRFPSSNKNSSTRAALFRNDTRSTTFSRRTVRSKRVKTAASKSSSRSGKNANAPQPKRRQEEHDKKTLVDSSRASISLPKADALTNRRQKRKTASTNVMAQQILDLATSKARIKTMGPAKCS